MDIHQFPLGKFVPYSRQLRKNDHAVAHMVASINEYGFKIPVLSRSDGTVVDGDLRLKAARKLGMTEVPVILCDEWSDTQVKAFRLMANRPPSWAEWDLELVALKLQDLKAFDFDLSLTGFEAIEIDEMLFGEEEKKEDNMVPELPTEAATRTGDLWVCGSHRVLYGDATSPESVATLLGPIKPELMITDPPYGVEYDPQWRERAGLGTPRQSGNVPNDDRVDWTAAYKLFPGDVAYVWHAGLHAAEVARGLEAADFCIRSQIIWAKQHFALSRGDYHWQHESCWGVIYDPFLGSGTTLIAAELTDRVCCGLDIDQSYMDVIVKRWQQLTGKSAVLEGDNRSFDQVAAERAQEKVVA